MEQEVQKVQKDKQATEPTELTPEDIKKEGILARGLRLLKGAVGKVIPKAAVKESKESKKTGEKPPLPKKGLPKALVGAVIAVVALLIISSLASKFVSKVREGGKEGEGEEAVPTPTPVGYQRYKPSVYAGDPEILKLEEDVNVLDREVSSAILKDDTLKPPTVDFDINFKIK